MSLQIVPCFPVPSLPRFPLTRFTRPRSGRDAEIAMSDSTTRPLVSSIPQLRVANKIEQIQCILWHPALSQQVKQSESPSNFIRMSSDILHSATLPVSRSFILSVHCQFVSITLRRRHSAESARGYNRASQMKSDEQSAQRGAAENVH